MHRISSSGAVADKHGAGKPGFTEGNPVLGVQPTEVGDDFLDAVQEEVATLIERYGIDLQTVSTDTYAQMYRAVKWASLKPMILHLLSEFEEIDLGFLPSQVHAIATHTQTSGVNAGLVSVVAAGNGGLIRYSNNGGLTWATATHAPSNAVRKLIVGGGYFWAITDNGGVSRALVDALGTFVSLGTGISSGNHLRGGAWIGTQSWLCVVGVSGGIWTGTSSTYTARTSGTAQNLTAADVDAIDNNIVCAAGGTDIVRSSDGGQTFSVVFTDGTAITDIYYDASERMWVASDGTSVHRSLDGGLTWSTLAGLFAPWATNVYGVVALAGLIIGFDSDAAAGYGCRVLVAGDGAAVAWRSAAQQLQELHPLYFDRVQGQFWLTVGAADRVYRTKKAPGAFLRAIVNG